MKYNKIWLVLIFFVTFCPFDVCAYDDEKTHPELTANAVNSSIIVKDSYLSENLGDDFSTNENTIIKGKQISKWFEKGSTEEDSPDCRAASHFLNPLKPWNEAGLSDTKETILGTLLVDPGCFVLAPFDSRYSIHKYSNLTWATGYTSPTDDWALTGNNADWNSARSYYSLALTERDKNLRETYFANAFQSLGQVLHLIQDMAVPAHTRNDFSAHLAFQKLEGKNPIGWMGNTYEWMVKDKANNSLMTFLMENINASDIVNPPGNFLTGFWDANKYDGSNPSSSLTQGLSEYTNGNFFSESTIFAEEKDSSDLHYFPRPAKSDTDAKLVEVLTYDGQTDNVRYVSKVGSDDKLAAYSYLQKWVENQKAYKTYENEGWEYNLDDEVYKDYAKQLLPRAVGYSAGLINYFFRGEIDMIKNENNPGKYIIKNLSSEAMDDATCTLYYDDENENRIEVTGASWPCNIAANGQIEVESFTAPTDPKPKKKGEYMLVFKGKLGNEENVSVGKVVKFDIIPSVRAVQVGKSSYAKGYITVVVDSGKITGRLPLPTGVYSKIVAVRFDQNDWNTFFVLEKHSPVIGEHRYYYYHKYSIDESSMTLIYHGVPVKDATWIKYEYSEEILSEWIDKWYDSRRKDVTLKKTFDKISNLIYDFSVNDGVIKPFRITANESNSYVVNTECWLNDGNDWDCWDGYSIGRLNLVRTQTIYYGDAIQESTYVNCTGGVYTGGNVEECKSGSVDPFIRPVAIFNSNDYAYTYGSELVSTLPVEIPSYVSSSSDIRTMLRENDKYSFYTGKKNNPYLSFSSEIGVVECGGLFMTDIKDGENYIGWRSGSTISFNSCSDWTTLKSGSINTGFYYLFDVVFQK